MKRILFLAVISVATNCLSATDEAQVLDLELNVSMSGRPLFAGENVTAGHGIYLELEIQNLTGRAVNIMGYSVGAVDAGGAPVARPPHRAQRDPEEVGRETFRLKPKANRTIKWAGREAVQKFSAFPEAGKFRIVGRVVFAVPDEKEPRVQNVETWVEIDDIDEHTAAKTYLGEERHYRLYIVKAKLKDRHVLYMLMTRVHQEKPETGHFLQFLTYLKSDCDFVAARVEQGWVFAQANPKLQIAYSDAPDVLTVLTADLYPPSDPDAEYPQFHYFDTRREDED